jgi:hypothetical protein
VREEPDVMAEGVGEAISTTSVALKADRYRPRIYGFQLNEIAKLQRWQEAVRDRSVYNTFSIFLVIDYCNRQVTRLEELEERT